jgi:deferrochelatase/peroxidase EfeB
VPDHGGLALEDRKDHAVGRYFDTRARRGLLVACYQASIEDEFDFVQTRWVNNATFPSDGDGVDAILNEQAVGATTVTIPGANPPQVPLQSFITMTSGAYFFAPSISALHALSAP